VDKMKTKARILLAGMIVALASMTTLFVGGGASAAPPRICYVVVVIDEPPGVIAEPGKIGVDTGSWHTEQNCVTPGPTITGP
jgi:hypothetical protein